MPDGCIGPQLDGGVDLCDDALRVQPHHSNRGRTLRRLDHNGHALSRTWNQVAHDKVVSAFRILGAKSNNVEV